MISLVKGQNRDVGFRTRGKSTWHTKSRQIDAFAVKIASNSTILGQRVQAKLSMSQKHPKYLACGKVDH